MTNHTDLIARLRKDDLFWEAPITCRSEAADALEAAQAEIANLHTVMMAAAVEISEHWDAHCDAEGYGPVNLLRRLENGYPDKYGYDSHTVVRMEKERDAALARLAELTKQEPVAAQIRVAIASESDWSDWREINLSDADREYRNGVETRKLYAAAGASPVQPTDLQAENAKLITALAACRDTLPVPDAGSMVDNWYCTAMVDPLQVPEYVKACVENMNFHRDFYQRRVDLLQQWQSKMRDPERTICCDIIANGQTLPPENAGNRYAVQPSQGLQSVADALTIEQLNDKVDRLMAVQPSQAVEVSKQDIYDIAHRKATRYVCTAAPSDVMYGFSEMHLLDFVAAINAKESGK